MLLPLIYQRIVLQTHRATREISRIVSRHPWLARCVCSVVCRPSSQLFKNLGTPKPLGPVEALITQLSHLDVFAWEAPDLPSEKLWGALRKKSVLVKVYLCCLTEPYTKCRS